MLCPHCRVDLVMSDRQGIEIDFCPKCRGVWLDRGEMDKIIERSFGQASPGAQVQNATGAPSRLDDRHGSSSSHGGDHGGDGYRRRKSWLGELFD